MHLEYTKPGENAAALGSKLLWFLILVLLHMQCYLTKIFAYLRKSYHLNSSCQCDLVLTHPAIPMSDDTEIDQVKVGVCDPDP